MADKSVSELIAATQVTPTDLFVLEQSGTAKKLTGQILENWLVSFADGHGGIQSIVKKSTSGLVDTYRITLADTTTFDFLVTNGKSINSISKTSTSGLVDTYTIRYNDNTSGTFTVTNGAKGDKGDNQYVWIKYASQEPTASSHSMGDVADNWIGIYSGESATAPTDWTQYEWFQIKGEKGDTGEAARLMSSAVEYQVSDSGTIIPSGAWSASVPVVAQGKYLWTRTTNTFNSGSSVVSYSVSRMGLDGSGSVSSVANTSPDENGNVPLTAEDVGALPNTGGDMTGELRMNGQLISGLNEPTENDQAANMGFVNQQMKKAAPYNYAHNSDFTQWVAQSGVGGLHGNQTYAGDRWILVSGTVSGDARADGMGYHNITLNGTIKQKVANAPNSGKAAIEMISGVADISYNNGEIIITSSGGVIKNVLLCDAEVLPEYQPKGYDVEKALCQLYYYKAGTYTKGYCVGTSAAKNTVRPTFPMPVTMRKAPNAVYNSANANNNIYAGGVTYNITSISAYAQDGQLMLNLTFEGTIPAHTSVQATIIGLELIADL